MKVINYSPHYIFEWCDLVKKFITECISEQDWGCDDKDLHTTFHSWDERFAWGLLNEEGELVGCLAGVVVPHFFNYRNLIFQECMWYVLPEYRKGRAGVMLYKQCERDCKRHGITRLAFAHTKYMKGNFEKLYNGLGFKYLETHYEKVLTNGNE
jgi:hypothetical protein